MSAPIEPREPVERTDVWRSAHDLSYAKSLDICSNAERSTGQIKSGSTRSAS